MIIPSIAVGSWLQQIAASIMDGGDKPPSMDHLILVVPPKLPGTSKGDGQRVAKENLGKKYENDYRAGWRLLVPELVGILRQQGFVSGGDDQAVKWLKPPNGRWTVNYNGVHHTIDGQVERRTNKETIALGERSHDDQDLDKNLGQFRQGKYPPIELEVLSARAKTSSFKKFQAHPFAALIPAMTPHEREDLREDIIKHGVQMPIVTFQSKILDGTNRAWFAAELKKPVYIKEFHGTEAEAREHVISLNIKRRHLNDAQIDLLAYRMFGPDARMRAARAVGQSAARGGTLIERGRWPDRAAADAQKAGIMTTSDRIERIAQATSAPQTLAKIESGEIKTAKEAERSARFEKSGMIGNIWPAPAAPPKRDSVALHISRANRELDALLADDHPDKPIGDDVLESFRRLQDLLERVRRLLQDHRVI